MLKKALLGALSVILGSTLFVLFVSFTITTTLRPDHIKTWLANSDLYDTFVDNALAETKKSQQTNDNKNSFEGISITDPAVKDAAKKAFTPSLLRKTAESFVDGTFDWLDGKVAKPDFNIDLTQAKQTFVDNIIAYAKKRYEALPICAARTLPETTDPLKINCKPAQNLDFNMLLAKLKTDLLENQDFMSNTVITADTFRLKQGSGSQDRAVFFDQYRRAPDGYRLSRALPIIALILSLVLVVSIVLLSKPKLRGLRRVGWTLLVAGLLCGSTTWLASQGLAKAHHSILAKDSTVGAMKVSISQVITNAQHDLLQRAIVLSAAYLIAGASILVGVLIYNHRLKPISTPSPSERVQS